jgi:hypothetical protein
LPRVLRRVLLVIALCLLGPAFIAECWLLVSSGQIAGRLAQPIAGPFAYVALLFLGALVAVLIRELWSSLTRRA